ncbi:hypothetical protein WT21_09970 [Burkholderia territorii]|nr:hypothetical protein WT00_08865 [Burkholderia territorii]KVN42443.1 hypothetical protein WT12_28230 [Burkholderia territorii]KVQ50527.1 hypothetical protein WT21_09970 [Burkholderia territorii]
MPVAPRVSRTLASCAAARNCASAGGAAIEVGARAGRLPRAATRPGIARDRGQPASRDQRGLLQPL